MGRLLQMDAGKMELKCAEFNLWGCLDYCIEMLAMRCESKGLDLSYNMDESVPECVAFLSCVLQTFLTCGELQVGRQMSADA
jgi:hypothetical protein